MDAGQNWVSGGPIASGEILNDRLNRTCAIVGKSVAILRSGDHLSAYTQIAYTILSATFPFPSKLFDFGEPERPKKRLDSQEGYQKHQKYSRRQYVCRRPVPSLVHYPNRRHEDARQMPANQGSHIPPLRSAFYIYSHNYTKNILARVILQGHLGLR